jgi:hypothetical protein
MVSSGIPWSGRAVRWLFWRAPKRAARYTWDSNMALASDIGRRLAVFCVFGAWLWGFRWLVEHVLPIQGLRTLSAVLLLLWFWHGVNLFNWIRHARAGASRARALQREQMATLQELRGDVRQAMSTMANQARGGIDMFGAIRRQPQGPATKEEAFQAGQPWTEPPPGMEPLIPWRRLFRRRR